MKKLSEELNKKLTLSIRLVFITILMIFIYITLIQQTYINKLLDDDISLDKRMSDHEEFTKFMATGKRATYTDLRATFVLCDGYSASDSQLRRVEGMYAEHGKDTDFYRWLIDSNVIK